MASLRLPHAKMEKWRKTWSDSTEERYVTQSWYTPRGLARSMAQVVKEDLKHTYNRLASWRFWDPAAGSGRIYEQLPRATRLASDIRCNDFRFKADGGSHYHPNINFLTQNVDAISKSKMPIYIVANPPYRHLTYRFINRAFDGTYPIKRGLFLVSARNLQTNYLAHVDTSRCVLVMESNAITDEFDIWLSPRTKGPDVQRFKSMTVKLLLYYSTDEYKRVIQEGTG